MNEEQYLLTVLNEELAELQKEISKCIRFTPHHSEKPGQKTNFQRAIDEYSDVAAILEMLKRRNLNFEVDDMRYCEKVARTHQYMDFSMGLGVLKE